MRRQSPPSRAWPYAAALLAMCLLLTAPLLLIDVPPLLDYPNHLARAVALANPNDPYLSRFYALNWSIIPDLGIDLVLPPLLGVLPVHVAGRLVIAAVILLPVLGTIALSHAVFGQRSWWSLGSGLVAWNQASLLGFLNFTAGLGLGLLLSASWIAWRDRNPARALIVATLAAPAIFFCHLMGLVCFALIMGAYELRAVWSARGRSIARLPVALMPFVAPLLLYALSPLDDVQADARFGGVAEKLGKLIAPTENYVLPIDVAAAALIVAVAAVGLRPVMIHRQQAPTPTVSVERPAGGNPIARPGAALLALALAAVVFVLAPAEFKGVHHFDTRFTVLFGFLFFGCLDPRLPRGGGVLLAVLFCFRMVVLSLAWAGQQPVLAELREVIAAVPPGSTVFLTITESTSTQPRFGKQLSRGEPVLDHLAAILPIERRAWWPFLFDNASQQPIATREPYRGLALRTAAIDGLAGLRAADLCGFDFVLILTFADRDTRGQLAATRLAPIAQAGAASLFAVTPGECAGGRR